MWLVSRTVDFNVYSFILNARELPTNFNYSAFKFLYSLNWLSWSFIRLSNAFSVIVSPGGFLKGEMFWLWDIDF
jgi:hypothetical protein